MRLNPLLVLSLLAQCACGSSFSTSAAVDAALLEGGPAGPDAEAPAPVADAGQEATVDSDVGTDGPLEASRPGDSSAGAEDAAADAAMVCCHYEAETLCSPTCISCNGAAPLCVPGVEPTP